MISLVDELVRDGIAPGPGQCYGFLQPPILGGEYVLANVVIIEIEKYLLGYGSIHEQIKDVPDGSQVVLRPMD
jgi:hypothetical protein